MDKLLQIFDMAYKMSSLTRYSQTHLVKEESVLEHTGFVCLMAYTIGSELINTDNIDIGLLLRKAVTHDIDEIITGDIPRPTKYYSKDFRNAVQKIEDENMNMIAANLNLPCMYHDWERSKDGPEGFIVGLCDCLAVIYKAYYEAVMFGNKTIIDHVTSMRGDLDSNSFKASRFNYEGEKYIRKVIKDAHNICTEILDLEKK